MTLWVKSFTTCNHDNWAWEAELLVGREQTCARAHTQTHTLQNLSTMVCTHLCSFKHTLHSHTNNKYNFKNGKDGCLGGMWWFFFPQLKSTKKKKKTYVININQETSTHFFLVCVCECVYMSLYLLMHAHCARGQRRMSLLFSLLYSPLCPWDKISHWTWSSLPLPSWLLRLSLASVSILWSCCGQHRQSSLAFTWWV